MIPVISVIIPVYGEADRINRTLNALKSSVSQMLWAIEIIVVDGDPEKATLKAINDPDVIKTASPPGRGVQMNHGAGTATGDLLLFLHADTVLPSNALKTILHVCRVKGAAAGAFDLSIGDSHPAFRIIEKVATLRSRVTRIPFGDQAIFFNAQCFWALGGYKPIALMEDVDIMRRLRKKGYKIQFISDPVVTSARRWKIEGMIYTTLRNWMLQLLFYMGADPEKLKAYYN